MATSVHEFTNRLEEAWAKLPGGASEVRSAFMEARESGSFTYLPGLIPFLFPPVRGPLAGVLKPGLVAVVQSLQVEASALAVELVNAMRCSTVPKLDFLLRGRVYTHGPGWFGWHGLDPVEVEGVSEGGEGAEALIALLTLHPSGHIRAKALGCLAQKRSPRYFAFLLLRVNDWVYPVRTQALRQFRRAMVDYSIAELIPFASIVMNLESYGRVDHRGLINEFCELLSSEDSLSGLLKGFESSDPRVRRACVQIAKRISPIRRILLVHKASTDSDIVVRLWAASELELFESIAPKQADALRGILYGDPVASIYLQALRSDLRVHRERVLEHLPLALLHRSGAVRNFARFHLKNSDRAPYSDRGYDFAKFYRTSLAAEGRTRIAGINGLAETGSVSDALLLTPMVNDKSTKVARAALRGCARLDKVSMRRLLLERLTDERSGVRREALRMLGARLPNSDFELIWDACKHAISLGDFRFPVVLLERSATWCRLSGFLLMATHDDPASSQVAVKWLRNWKPEVCMVKQGVEEKKQCSDAFAQARPSLPKDVVENLLTSRLPFSDEKLFPKPGGVELTGVQK